METIRAVKKPKNASAKKPVHFARPLHLLRRHIVWCAYDVLRAGEADFLRRYPNHLGDAKVRDFYPPFFIEQDVLRLNIAMDDAFVVCELERITDLRNDLQCL